MFQFYSWFLAYSLRSEPDLHSATGCCNIPGCLSASRVSSELRSPVCKGTIVPVLN
jgi:hypothetical protein